MGTRMCAYCDDGSFHYYSFYVLSKEIYRWFNKRRNQRLKNEIFT